MSIDFSLIKNCINYEFLELFRGLDIINDGYYFKLLRRQNGIRIYIEEMGKNKQYLLQYSYKNHTYILDMCSLYRNERVILYNNRDNDCLEDISKYFIEKIMTPDYINKKLISNHKFRENGYFLINKIINAYYNPAKGLCQKISHRNYESVIQDV